MRLFTLFLLTIFTTSCSSHITPMSGKIIDGRYYDPKGIFSVKARNGVEIIEYPFQGEKDAGVAFQSIIGQMERIEVIVDAKEFCDELLPNLDHHSCNFELIYERIANSFPETKVLEKKSIEIEGIGTACAGIFFIPKGSTMVDAITRERQDSIRSYLFSYAENDLVIISVQESPSITSFRSYAANDERANEVLLEETINIRKDYRKVEALPAY